MSPFPRDPLLSSAGGPSTPPMFGGKGALPPRLRHASGTRLQINSGYWLFLGWRWIIAIIVSLECGLFDCSSLVFELVGWFHRGWWERGRGVRVAPCGFCPGKLAEVDSAYLTWYEIESGKNSLFDVCVRKFITVVYLKIAIWERVVKNLPSWKIRHIAFIKFTKMKV